MVTKKNYNLAEKYVDMFADFVRGIISKDNLALGSYYKIQKLVAGLGLPFSDDRCIHW